ncbi:ABC transporter substrate-binding protein [Neobacillus muris]|uniref:ABC transporter substrate-binding protein n=1 Tax=Neobacillus muris TaxID=2941334 RepID=UPI00203AE6A5|nr:ABC transporter substrate-binding protein [Neobacillus muris]
MKRFKEKKLWFITLLSAFMLILSACGNNNAQDDDSKTDDQQGGKEKTTIKLGMVCGGITPLLGQMGINDGSFQEAGLNVEKVCFTAGSDAVQALVGGSIDVNLASMEHVLKLRNNNLKVKAYGALQNGFGYSLVVKNDAGFDSLKDVKGSTLAVTKPGTLSDTGLRMGLEKEGLDPEKDVKIVAGGSGSSMLASIEGGQVAGGMIAEPALSEMVSGGKYRVLYEPKFDYPGIIVMAKEDWVGKNKDAMKTFLKVLEEKGKEDPKTAVDVMQSEFKEYSPEILEKAISSQLSTVPDGLKITEDGVDLVNKASMQLGIINKEVSFKDAVDLSLLP